MPTPFLLQFSSHLVEALMVREAIEIEHGRMSAVIEALADHLARASNRSLVSEVSRGLLACPWVLELFADDEQIKTIITDLEPVAARG